MSAWTQRIDKKSNYINKVISFSSLSLCVVRWGCGENPLTPLWLVVDASEPDRTTHSFSSFLSYPSISFSSPLFLLFFYQSLLSILSLLFFAQPSISLFSICSLLASSVPFLSILFLSLQKRNLSAKNYCKYRGNLKL